MNKFTTTFFFPASLLTTITNNKLQQLLMIIVYIAPTCSRSVMRCVLQFSQDFHWVQFRHAELDALLRMHGIDPATAYSDPLRDKEHAFLFIDLPNIEIIESICSRSILIRNVYELWAHSDRLSSLVTSVKSLPDTFLEPYVKPTVSWSVQVDPFCRSYSMQQKERWVEDNVAIVEDVKFDRYFQSSTGAG